eukprot:COSAG01_NODE_1704_length_9434_cov_159.120193_3_plen_435_part_00
MPKSKGKRKVKTAPPPGCPSKRQNLEKGGGHRPKGKGGQQLNQQRLQAQKAAQAVLDRVNGTAGDPGLRSTVVNSRGRRRGYRENCVFLTIFCSLFSAAVAVAMAAPGFLVEDMPDPRVIAGRLGRQAGMRVQNAEDLALNFLEDGSVLVQQADHHGFGSPASIESARRLNTEQLRTIDQFIEAQHGEGTCVSMLQIRAELLKQHPEVTISEYAVRYAVTNYCNDGSGYYWGRVKPRKITSDPDRIDVKRTYLASYAAALKKEEAGTHICVYLDESYLHQYHAAAFSWLKFEPDGAHINRGNSSGKRLIMLHAITKDGPLVTRYPSGHEKAGQPIDDRTWGRGKSKDIAQTERDGLTAELLWTASQSTGDYHDNMDSERFMDWVRGRLIPTFEALYGKGTALGGRDGKKMIVVSDNACVCALLTNACALALALS